MKRSQQDRPSVKDILSLKSVQDQARRIGIYIGVRGKPRTVQDLIG